MLGARAKFTQRSNQEDATSNRLGARSGVELSGIYTRRTHYPVLECDEPRYRSVSSGAFTPANLIGHFEYWPSGPNKLDRPQTGNVGLGAYSCVFTQGVKRGSK